MIFMFGLEIYPGIFSFFMYIFFYLKWVKNYQKFFPFYLWFSYIVRIAHPFFYSCFFCFVWKVHPWYWEIFFFFFFWETSVVFLLFLPNRWSNLIIILLLLINCILSLTVWYNFGIRGESKLFQSLFQKKDKKLFQSLRRSTGTRR